MVAWLGSYVTGLMCGGCIHARKIYSSSTGYIHSAGCGSWYVGVDQGRDVMGGDEGLVTLQCIDTNGAC